MSPSQKAKSKKQKLDTDAPVLPVLNQKDVWIDGIIPFVGMGHYAFVGAVNKKMNHLYKEYCDSVEDPPMVAEDPPMVQNHQNGKKCQATSTVTTYSAAFYNESTAEIWFADDSNTKVPSRRKVCEAIARLGNNDVLQLAHDKGFPWNEDTCAAAAKGGHLNVLKWLRENGCPWNETTCAFAAKGGHSELLKWALEYGCPWDRLTCAYAAGSGHFALLKWARANGCPWTEATSASAAEGGHLEILKWAVEHGCSVRHPLICANAAEHGHLETLNGCVKMAAHGGQIRVRRLLMVDIWKY
ncbi:ankyrin repeat protein [Seminavis robusta]|uniref:Ankyrin repeat protein n=1 Tax=Seminavis robusta TaxID=568900 RepID=A0A9N8HRW3_9STRA|nr:ankyrin repeat protein [Seminavis robusta]|eukprot:Sro1365_g266560.1 ankyrin repeat protein (299) ;mRNA; r:18465-19361